jgi:hypothetical protein
MAIPPELIRRPAPSGKICLDYFYSTVFCVKKQDRRAKPSTAKARGVQGIKKPCRFQSVEKPRDFSTQGKKICARLKSSRLSGAH